MHRQPQSSLAPTAQSPAHEEQPASILHICPQQCEQNRTDVGMGANSSQPTLSQQTPQRIAPLVEPRHSPTMDDNLASQQLIDDAQAMDAEIARTPPSRQKRRAKEAQTSEQQTRVLRSLCNRTDPQHVQNSVSASPPVFVALPMPSRKRRRKARDDVQVPDSQNGPAFPMSPPTLSWTVPASMANNKIKLAKAAPVEEDVSAQSGDESAAPAITAMEDIQMSTEIEPQDFQDPTATPKAPNVNNRLSSLPIRISTVSPSQTSAMGTPRSSVSTAALSVSSRHSIDQSRIGEVYDWKAPVRGLNGHSSVELFPFEDNEEADPKEHSDDDDVVEVENPNRSEDGVVIVDEGTDKGQDEGQDEVNHHADETHGEEPVSPHEESTIAGFHTPPTETPTMQNPPAEDNLVNPNSPTMEISTTMEDDPVIQDRSDVEGNAGIDVKPEIETDVAVQNNPVVVDEPSEDEGEQDLDRNDSGDQTTAADRALNADRDLNHPPELKSEGDFTSDEEELLRRAISDYQRRKNYETHEVVDTIQHTHESLSRLTSKAVRDTAENETDMVDECKSFWNEMLQAGLKRELSQIKGYLRRTYHVFKSGPWTDEDDRQLYWLEKDHGRKWSLISIVMGNRSSEDVQSRWEIYLHHYHNRAKVKWTRTEDELLRRAVATVVQRNEVERQRAGGRPVAVYTPDIIDWTRVAVSTGNLRPDTHCRLEWERLISCDPTEELSIQPIPDPHRQDLPKEDPDKVLLFLRHRKIRKSVPQDLSESGQKRGRGRPRKYDRPVKRPKKEVSATEQQRTAPTAEPYGPTRRRGRTRKSEADSKSNKPRRPVGRPRKSDVSMSQFADVDTNGTSTAGSTLQVVEEQQTTQSSDHNPEIPGRNLRSRVPGIQEMCWGDKADLVEIIAKEPFEDEASIDWDMAAADMKHEWQQTTLQTALTQLLKFVPDQGSISDRATKAFEHLAHTIDADKLREHYRPKRVIEENHAEPEETVNGDGTPVRSNMKRQRAERDMDESPELPQRKRPRGTTAGRFKSAPIILDSDEEEEDMSEHDDDDDDDDGD